MDLGAFRSTPRLNFRQSFINHEPLTSTDTLSIITIPNLYVRAISILLLERFWGNNYPRRFNKYNTSTARDSLWYQLGSPSVRSNGLTDQISTCTILTYLTGGWRKRWRLKAIIRCWNYRQPLVVCTVVEFASAIFRLRTSLYIFLELKYHLGTTMRLRTQQEDCNTTWRRGCCRNILGKSVASHGAWD